MYTVHDWAEVRLLHEREHLSKKHIAERLGMSRTTVHRLLELTEPPRYERPRRPCLLDAQLSGDPTVYFDQVSTTDRGDVVGLSGYAAAAVAGWAYDPYGNPVASSVAAGGMPAGVAARIAAAQPLRYAGYAYDDFSGLYYCSQRYYDPATMQFLSADAAKADGEQSAYQYCGGDPVDGTDPSGLMLDGGGGGRFAGTQKQWKRFIRAYTHGVEYHKAYKKATGHELVTVNFTPKKTAALPKTTKSRFTVSNAITLTLGVVMLGVGAVEFVETGGDPTGVEAGTADVGSVLEPEAEADEDVIAAEAQLTGGRATANNYRTNFYDENPDTPADYQVHHSLPQKYADGLAQDGINVHETQYLRGVDPGFHRLITNEWGAFDRAYAGAPPMSSVHSFANYIDNAFGSSMVFPD